jgi:hypothetical protein
METVMEHLVPFIVALVRFFTLLLAVYNTMEFVWALVDTQVMKHSDNQKQIAVFREKMGRHISAASFGWALFVLMAMYKGG